MVRSTITGNLADEAGYQIPMPEVAKETKKAAMMQGSNEGDDIYDEIVEQDQHQAVEQEEVYQYIDTNEMNPVSQQASVYDDARSATTDTYGYQAPMPMSKGGDKAETATFKQENLYSYATMGQFPRHSVTEASKYANVPGYTARRGGGIHPGGNDASALDTKVKSGTVDIDGYQVPVSSLSKNYESLQGQRVVKGPNNYTSLYNTDTFEPTLYTDAQSSTVGHDGYQAPLPASDTSVEAGAVNYYQDSSYSYATRGELPNALWLSAPKKATASGLYTDAKSNTVGEDGYLSPLPSQVQNYESLKQRKKVKSYNGYASLQKGDTSETLLYTDARSSSIGADGYQVPLTSPGTSVEEGAVNYCQDSSYSYATRGELPNSLWLSTLQSATAAGLRPDRGSQMVGADGYLAPAFSDTYERSLSDGYLKPASAYEPLRSRTKGQGALDPKLQDIDEGVYLTSPNEKDTGQYLTAPRSKAENPENKKDKGSDPSGHYEVV